MSSPNDADQRGDQALKSPLPRPTGRNGNAGGGADADVERYAEPDVGADREAPAQEAEGRSEGDGHVNKPALGIKQIEDLEDDAMGG
jgi:hypothetical protein